MRIHVTFFFCLFGWISQGLPKIPRSLGMVWGTGDPENAVADCHADLPGQGVMVLSGYF